MYKYTFSLLFNTLSYLHLFIKNNLGHDGKTLLISNENDHSEQLENII